MCSPFPSNQIPLPVSFVQHVIQTFNLFSINLDFLSLHILVRIRQIIGNSTPSDYIFTVTALLIFLGHYSFFGCLLSLCFCNFILSCPLLGWITLMYSDRCYPLLNKSLCSIRTLK